MTSQQTLRIFTNGGIVSPEELRKLILIARQSGCESVSPGFRQELYLQVGENQLPDTEKALAVNGLKYAAMEDSFENIVTSYAALDIFPTSAWLMGDAYLGILDSFACQPRLKINLVDPQQNLVPLFTGELNFIASAYPRYWHLYVNFSRFGRKQVWPLLIDGDDLGRLAKLIEEIYFQHKPENMQALFTAVQEQFTGRSRHPEQELQLPAHAFPVIEGLYKAGSTYWLGIYRRNQTFSVDFLEALYQVCIQSKIGKICLTPHKTLLIKDIREESLLLWEKMLGIHGINMQHSALELNWQLPDLDTEAIRLKNALVREFEEKEVRTAGVSFALRTRPMEVAASVLIEPSPEAAGAAGEPVYAVSYVADFSAQHTHWQLFAGQVHRQALASTLIQLRQLYYAQIGKTAVLTEETVTLTRTHEVYQCTDCQTVYDPEYGDPAAGIPAGISFHQLPETYACSLCDTPKTRFTLVEIPESSLG